MVGNLLKPYGLSCYSIKRPKLTLGHHLFSFLSSCVVCFLVFFGLAYQGKDIVFRFIIEYGSLMNFGP